MVQRGTTWHNIAQRCTTWHNVAQRGTTCQMAVGCTFSTKTWHWTWVVETWHNTMDKTWHYDWAPTRPIARLFCGGGVKLVKFWDLLWLRVDYLAITLDLAIFFFFFFFFFFFWGGGGGSGDFRILCVYCKSIILTFSFDIYLWHLTLTFIMHRIWQGQNWV